MAQVRPVVAPAGSKINFGVEIDNVDLENISDSEFATIKDAVYKHLVVIFRNQSALTPKGQFLLMQLFDPQSSSYGHGKTMYSKSSILHRGLQTVPHQSQVQIIGNGTYDSYEGLTNFTLQHPHHRTFHKTVISEAEDLAVTRFFRWHMDAALYELNPPQATSLLAVKVPGGRRQTLRYDDGTGDELDVPLAATAFVSGETMYSLLSAEDQEFARTSFIEYAPHPFIWMSKAKSRSDGLGLVSEGLELSDNDLPPIDPSKIQILPMVWKNPVTGNLALEVQPSAVKAIHRASGSKITDLQEVRAIVHRLLRPGIAPELVYAHDWREGDCVVFNNRGVLHSVVGALSPHEKRLVKQCNIAAAEGVMGPDGVVD